MRERKKNICEIYQAAIKISWPKKKKFEKV